MRRNSKRIVTLIVAAAMIMGSALSMFLTQEAEADHSTISDLSFDSGTWGSVWNFDNSSGQLNNVSSDSGWEGSMGGEVGSTSSGYPILTAHTDYASTDGTEKAYASYASTTDWGVNGHGMSENTTTVTMWVWPYIPNVGNSAITVFKLHNKTSGDFVKLSVSNNDWTIQIKDDGNYEKLTASGHPAEEDARGGWQKVWLVLDNGRATFWLYQPIWGYQESPDIGGYQKVFDTTYNNDGDTFGDTCLYIGDDNTTTDGVCGYDDVYMNYTADYPPASDAPSRLPFLNDRVLDNSLTAEWIPSTPQYNISHSSMDDAVKGVTCVGDLIYTTTNLEDTVRIYDRRGNYLDSFSSPCSNPQSLAYDGEYIYHGGSGGTTIYKTDLKGNTVSSFSHPEGQWSHGLAFDGTNLWTCTYSNNWVYEIQTDGTLVTNITVSGIGGDGLAFDGTDLWSCDAGGDTIKQFDTSGNILRTINTDSSHVPVGLGFDGSSLWEGEYGNHNLYKYVSSNITFKGEADQSVWSNSTGDGHETMKIQIVPGVGAQDVDINEVRISWDALTDGGTDIASSNVELYVSSDNSSFASMGYFTGTDNISITDSNWPAGADTSPFPLNDQWDNIYCRFKLDVPSGQSMDTYTTDNIHIYLWR